MAKILVTGGLGTIGQGLVKELSSRGHEVFLIDLYHGENQQGFSLRTDVKNPTYARCDVGEMRQLEMIFNKWGNFDFVYHCAAEFGRWNGEDYYEQVWRSNGVGTKNIIRLQERLGFKLIHFSSSEVYGDWPEIMVEDVMDKYEIKQMNDYAMSKWVNEMQIKNSAIQYGTKTVVVRIFNTYGPGEYYSPYRSVNCRFIYCALAGIPWLVFRGYTRTSTFLADSVRTISNIVDNFIPGETYNIGGDQYHTVEEFSDLVLKVTGANPSLVEYRDAEVLTTRHKKVDVSKAVNHLNHKTTVTLEDGIFETVAWMRGVYKF
ncbi:MAG: NAD(P)-dependent oxidoreductase [Cyclobacteriaceae bacterium]|nr:NAD(P)-dependent oxidoreductase [Cyclobacteriaceae bacterium]